MIAFLERFPQIGVGVAVVLAVAQAEPVAPEIDTPEVDVPFSEKKWVAPARSDAERAALVKAVKEAFAEADRVEVISLEPMARMMRQRDVGQEKLERLRGGEIGGIEHYGGVVLPGELIPEFRTAILERMSGSKEPMIGFCWAPRHAVVIKRKDREDLVITICYACKGMRVDHDGASQLFFAPWDIKSPMDSLFDAHGIEKSDPDLLHEKLPRNY